MLLAFERVAPKVPTGVLLAGSYAMDIIWGSFYAAGIEQYPSSGITAICQWSHGLFMSVVWTLTAALFSRSFRTDMIMGLIFFSGSRPGAGHE